MGLRIEKVKREISDWKDAISLSVSKRNWKNPIDWTHFYFDLIVESLRELPYTLGHVMGIALPIILIIVI